MKEDYNRKSTVSEETKYKKKSQNKPPTKSNHKHEYHDCIFEWDNPRGKFDKEKGFITEREIFGGSYCVVCGKMSYDMSFKWRNVIHDFRGWYHSVLSEKAKQELNPETRTLPTFVIDDRWNQKYVNIN